MLAFSGQHPRGKISDQLNIEAKYVQLCGREKRMGDNAWLGRRAKEC